jgi:hypothetical protein
MRARRQTFPSLADEDQWIQDGGDDTFAEWSERQRLRVFSGPTLVTMTHAGVHQVRAYGTSFWIDDFTTQHPGEHVQWTARGFQ